MTVPVVLAAVVVGAQHVAHDSAGTLPLGVGVLVVGQADEEAQAHPLDEGTEHLARGELAGFFPCIDRIFPTATLQRCW